MSEKIFRSKAPGIMAQLMRDFPISVEDAAAILGNLGHESGGLATLQEIKPTVAGSKGGYGWAQWTGPRRRAYEAYCARNGFNPASDEANYKYLFVELRGIEGSEKGAIDKLAKAKTLDDKVVAFEKAFLRAGIKHYPSRKQWAKVALNEWRNVLPSGVPIPAPTDIKPGATPVPPPREGGVNWVLVIGVLLVLAAIIWFVFFKR